MKLQLIQIIDRGIPNKERLHLRVLEDANLSYYIVFATTYLSPQAISNLQRHAYWFAPKNVKAGDEVVLYTGSGSPSESKIALGLPGRTAHFFFWGLPNTVWNVTGDCAVLLELNSWQTSKYE